MFYIIEGSDGSGKTTVIDSLRRELPNAHFVAEFHCTEDCDKLIELRKMLVDTIGNSNSNVYQDCIMFTLIRDIVLNSFTIPLLEKGETVIMDRFILSTYVYQYFRYSKKDRDQYVLKLIQESEEKFLSLLPCKAHYLYLSVDETNTVESRIKTRQVKKTKFESNLAGVLDAYNEAVDVVKGDITHINATLSKEDVLKSVLQVIK